MVILVISEFLLIPDYSLKYYIESMYTFKNKNNNKKKPVRLVNTCKPLAIQSIDIKICDLMKYVLYNQRKITLKWQVKL